MNWPVGDGNGEGSLQESAPENGGYWRFCATGKTSFITGVQLSLFYPIRMWNMLTIRHQYPTYITIHVKKINDQQVSCWTDTAESLQAKYERRWIKNNHCQPKPIFLMQSSELRTRFHFYHIILFCLMLWIMINLSEVLVTSYNLRTS